MTLSTNNNHSLLPACSLSALLLTCVISNTLAAETKNLQLGIHQVGNWHAPDDSQLIIEDHQQQLFFATLKATCQGLSAAKSIAFISNADSALDQFSSVVLPSGKRCPFKSFSKKEPLATNSN